MASWYFPVSGENKWSGGSWMPNTKNHRGRTHAAIDIYAKEGTPIVAPIGGTIMAIGVDTSIGGNWVQMRGDDGIVYYFAHLYRPPKVSKGQRVEAQTYLGGVGRSGSAKNTSPHLHFSMKYNGKAVNPRKWFEDGAEANPDNYTFQYQDPRAGLNEDPWFNPNEGRARKDTQLRDNVMQMLDMMSNSIAGGQRGQASMGDELVDYVVNPTRDEGSP